MWLERFVIIVPTLTRQRMPAEGAFYVPTWVEWSILGRLHLSLHAPLCPVYKGLPYCPGMGGERG